MRMQVISLREFQLHPTKYLKELPVTLTQYNIPVAIITSTGNVPNVGIEVVASVNKPSYKCELPFCKAKSTGFYRITADAGETTKEIHLCDFHWNKARREPGAEVIEIDT